MKKPPTVKELLAMLYKRSPEFFEAQPERPRNCGSGFCSRIECVMEKDDEDAQGLSDRDMGDN